MTQHGGWVWILDELIDSYEIRVPIGAKEPKGDFKDWVIPLFECPNHLRFVNFSITLYIFDIYIYIYTYVVIVHI